MLSRRAPFSGLKILASLWAEFEARRDKYAALFIFVENNARKYTIHEYLIIFASHNHTHTAFAEPFDKMCKSQMGKAVHDIVDIDGVPASTTTNNNEQNGADANIAPTPAPAVPASGPGPAHSMWLNEFLLKLAGAKDKVCFSFLLLITLALAITLVLVNKPEWAM
jgi:hypothetical protein